MSFEVSLQAQILTHPSDLWAIGVIAFFMVSGTQPFERDTDLEELQAILIADYSFEPEELWYNVTDSCRDFINRCLTVDPVARITAHEALSHPWITGEGADPSSRTDLLPGIKKNFNARRTLHAAIDTIRAINQLRAGGAAMGMPTPAKAENSGQNGDAMEGVETGEQQVDPRGNARGQDESQIRAQQTRIMQTIDQMV